MKRSCHPNLTDGKFAKSNSFHFKTTHKRLIFNYFKELLTRFNGTAMIVDTSDLLVARSFEWIKIGSSEATGLSEFGLIWSNNDNNGYAQIEPMNGTLLFVFNVFTWNDIITEQGKNELFTEVIQNNEQIPVFDKIRVTSNIDYDYVIGTKTLDGNSHIIHITTTEVFGDNAVILGQIK